LNKDKAFLAISLACRIAVGILSLLVLARALGPSDYGFVATVLAYSAIASLVTDFGFGVQALRDIGAEPHRAGELIAACIRVKNYLVIIATALFLTVLLSLTLSRELFAASMMLYGSIMIMSYGDLAIMALRGTHRFDVEAYAMLASALIFMIIVVGAAWLDSDLLVLSAAVLAARTMQSIVCFVAVGRLTRFGNFLFGRLSDTLRFARQSSGLALDTILTVIPSQLDTIFVSHFLGLHSAGIYQVASRLANFIQIPVQILAQVYMPRLSHSRRHDYAAAQKLERKMLLEFSGIGSAIALAFLVVAPPLTPIAFGKEFVVPFDVWVAFALLVIAKATAGALGVALAARRSVRYRVLGQALGVTSIIIGFQFLIPIFGLVAAPAAMIVGTVLTGSLYRWKLASLNRERGALPDE
jgi:O-antigen/teichoic acid export membrane protein